MINEKTLVRIALVFLVLGLSYRLFPILAGEAALAQFFITEDGYLMLTVARNLAIGNGLSVSAGEIATNGVQPLITFIFALPYWLTGGDKTASLVGILLISAGFASLGAAAVHAFAREALKPQTGNPVWPLFVAALWFVGPLQVFHTMNGLETGFYTLTVVLTLCYFGHLVARGGRYRPADQILLGALCGLVFLARNDGAFLVTALFLVRLIQVQASGQANFRQAVIEALPPGMLSLVLAAPWLVFNYRLFGSIMPISGHAESIAATFGSNLTLSPIKIFETMFPMLPIPGFLEGSLTFSILAGLAALTVLVHFVWQSFRRGSPFRCAILAYTIYAVLIFAYYSLIFGAPWFLSRYFAPLAPLFITALFSTAFDLVAPRFRQLLGGAALASLALSALLLLRLAIPGEKEQGHFQVVDWVRTNLPDETWVGAVQTGTLGYWHDRTINLDGKVNPAALRALMEDGDVLDYVIESEIEYLADWAGIADWANRTQDNFNAHFEVVVAEPEQNLGVLRRRADRS